MSSPSSSRPVPLCGAGRFQMAMSVRPCARSPHFLLHFSATGGDAADKLSTDLSTASQEPVDNVVQAPCGIRLGMVVPKRHARRSVTRVLVRRQLREGLRRHAAQLPAGDWVLRLRAPFDRQAFPSAASDALATALRQEIETLMQDAMRRLRGRPA